MGTRADFYIGRGKDAEWLGSIAWDGYPGGLDTPQLLASTAEPHYRSEVEKFLARRNDATLPADGWPWPWTDSRTTDYAYAFDGGRTWASAYGTEWFPANEPEPEVEDRPKVGAFPDMTEKQNVTFGKRSGIIVIGG